MEILARLWSFMFGSKPLMQQVYLDPATSKHYQISPDSFLSQNLCNRDHERFQKALTYHCPAEIWPGNCNLAACPRPILLHKHHITQVKDLHEALVLAVTDIVTRWWSDSARNFPERMPLEPEEEQLLKWLEKQTSIGLLPKYADHRGSWRPDFMVEELASPKIYENFRITEINARFSFNAFLIGLFGQKALQDMELGKFGLQHGAWPEQVMKGICTLFDASRPLYLLKGDEMPLDIAMLPYLLDRHYGITTHFIKPNDLRLVEDLDHPTGYKLCCVVKSSQYTSTSNIEQVETLQEIDQVALELRQHELAALDPEMLRQVSLRCFNDLRTILLVHDKRMLGIVKEELADLKHRGVINDRQVGILDRGIADSFLPGSKAIESLLLNSKVDAQLRNEFLLKPIRGGKGFGILFGDDLTSGQWLDTLQDLQTPKLSHHHVSYVVQRRIYPRMYNVVLQDAKPVRNPLIGTWQIVNGEYTELAGWRSSGERCCAVSHGGAWIVSVMPMDKKKHRRCMGN